MITIIHRAHSAHNKQTERNNEREREREKVAENVSMKEMLVRSRTTKDFK